jgi:hypothetical protein
MKRIIFKKISIRVIILSIIVLVAASIITGCHVNRRLPEVILSDTSSMSQQTLSGTSNQTNNGDKAENESTGNNEDTATVTLESKNESETASDKNRILFTFVISGDNRPANNENPQPEIFIKLLKYMKQQNPAFYINTGDIIMGNTDNQNIIKRQFSDYLAALKNLDVLNFVAPGNHDVANSMSEKYFLEMINQAAFDNAALAKIEINTTLADKKLSEDKLQETGTNEVQIENGSAKNGLYYYFEYKGVYFVIVNAYEKGFWGLVQGDQFFWLEQLLDQLKDKPVFVFLHPPPYSVLNPECITDGSLHVAFSSKENQDHIRELFARDKVDGVFCGHEHFYNKQEHDSVQYIITGCSGASPYASEEEGGFNHFLRMQIKENSWIMDVVDSSGNKVYAQEILFN